MTKTQTISMSDREHGLRGLGDISYKYTYKDKRHKLAITVHKLKQTLTYDGEDARRYYYFLIRDTDKETIELLKRIASDAIGIPVIRLKEKSQKKEVVWARNMVMWYVRNYLNYSLKETGLIFFKDHSSAIHAIEHFLREDKYLHDFQRISKKVFLQKCSSHRLFSGK